MKKDLFTKMIMIGGGGLVALVVTIGLIWALSGQTGHGPGRQTGDHTIPPEIGENELAFQVDSLNGQKFLALVKESGGSDSSLAVYDLENKSDLLLQVKGGTRIKSAYGEDIAISQIKKGQIIEGKYNKENFDAYAIHVSGRAWERKNPNAFSIMAGQDKIKIGNDEYQFDPALVMVFKGDQLMTLDQINVKDEVTIRGYQNEVWAIEVVAGHGTIVLKNADAYLGGTIEIGNRDIRSVEKDMQIEVAAGVKRVIISQDNMNPYSEDVFIEEGKEVVIDLGTFKPKVSKVTFTSVQEGVALYIDGQKQASANEEVTLEFGKHKLKAEKEGYLPWESDILVNQVLMEVRIDMKVEPQYLEVQTPAGAELYIDGARVGTIPARTVISPGQHTITIQKPGFYSKNQTINVENNGKNINYAFPDLMRIGANNQDPGKDGPSPTMPDEGRQPGNSGLKLNPTQDNY